MFMTIVWASMITICPDLNMDASVLLFTCKQIQNLYCCVAILNPD